MKRNMKATYVLTQIGNNKHSRNESDLSTILSYVSEIRSDVKQLAFHQKMDRVDVSLFFPVETDSQINEFLDRNNDGWEARKKGFHHLLYNAVSKCKKRFSCALLHLLFTRDYIRDHKWPLSGGYVILVLLVLCNSSILFFIFRSSRDDVSTVSYRLIGFLKATLGQMVGAGELDPAFINLDMWDSWPRKFYNIRTYDLTKVILLNKTIPYSKNAIFSFV